MQKKLYARQAEVYAGYTAYTDYEIGRVIQAVQDMGKLDNTLIIYIDGDNGTSPEGTLSGTYNQMTAYNGILDVPEPLQLLHSRTGARAATYPHMAVAWSWAFDTPFKWTKQVASHFGGTRQGMAISWPGHIKDVGGIRHQFHHMIDIVPTILEATGVKAPQQVDGIAQKPIEGVSMAYTFDSANANAAVTRKTQYFEMAGNRGIYSEGWYANTHPPVPPWQLNAKFPEVNEYRWELYNLTEDYSQNDDLAGKMPDKLKQMQALFQRRRRRTACCRSTTRSFSARSRRGRVRLRVRQCSLTSARPGIPIGNSPSILNKSFTITADIEVPKSGGNGMIVTEGGPRWIRALPVQGQAGIRLQPARLKRSRWEAAWAVRTGSASRCRQENIPSCSTSSTTAGYRKGRDRRAQGRRQGLATHKVEHTIPFLMPPDETFDVGVDTRTPVDSSYQIPFRFDGKIDKLTFRLGPTQLAGGTQEGAGGRRAEGARLC